MTRATGIGLAMAIALLACSPAPGAIFPNDYPSLNVTESVVRGQKITATVFPADPAAVAAGVKLRDKDRRDREIGVPRADVPFEIAFGTGDVWPGTYEVKAWTINEAGLNTSQIFSEVTVFPLPVMPDFELAPLMIADSRWLVGLRTTGIPKGARIYVWGKSFLQTDGVTRLRIHRTQEGSGEIVFRLQRRMLIPRAGGWPTLIAEVAPGSAYRRHGVKVRARVKFGSLYRNQRTKDTVFKSPNRQNYCTTDYGVLRNGAFPPRSSCVVAGD